MRNHGQRVTDIFGTGSRCSWCVCSSLIEAPACANAVEAEDEKALLVLLNKRCSELVDGKEALQVIICQSSLKAACSVTCR